MNEFVITNNRERKRAAFRLMHETRQNIRQFMTQWAGVLHRDLIAWTPPRARKIESWGVQKKRGEKTVARDIRKVFKSGKQLEFFVENHPLCKKRPRLAEQLKAYVRAGNVQALNRILAKISPGMQIVLEPSRALHFPQRNYRGVVRKAKQVYLLPRESSLKGYIREIQKDVGKAKAGWLTGKLPVRDKDIPAWVRRHQATDGAVVRLNGPVYQVTLRNTAPGTAGMRANEIVAPALRILEKKMGKSLEKVLAHNRRR